MNAARWLPRCRRSLRRPAGRRLFLALAALLLAVQIGFPAHEDSHPLGYPVTHCQYCVLGGHLFGMPSAALLPPGPAAHVEQPFAALIEFPVPPFPRTRFSRGPPSSFV